MLFTTMVVVRGCSRISTFISDWHKFYYDILKDAATPPSDGYGIRFPIWSVRVLNSDPVLKFYKYSPAKISKKV